MKKITLILADEDQNTLDEMKRNFTSERYEVLACTSDGEELIDLINRYIPDIVVMDIVLQKCDGFKVLESIRKSINTKIIVE